MDIVPGTSLVRPLPAPVVAIGNFDGVHLGHQALCRTARERAHAIGGTAVVLTFDPHPARVLAPDSSPPLLTRPARKAELIAAQGIDTLILEPFTRALAALTPDEFAEQILAGALGTAEVVVGWNFRFGARRAGDVATLRRLGDRLGFRVHEVSPLAVGGVAASSSQVRDFLRSGDVAGAARLLGRLHEAEGEVVHGAKRGRALGVPTANVAGVATLLPAPGIYATVATVLPDGPALPSVTSLGTNPTFGADQPLSLEVHVLDWDGDLYGRALRVGFHSFLRGEARYDDVNALVAQIRRDIDDARVALRDERS